VAGFYIHIPFCRKLCYYCDFHFTVSLKDKNRLVEALILEIQQRSNEYKDLVFDTIYFGGGTPSVLSIDEVSSIFNAIIKYYQISSNPEVTFESNPDDLSPEYLYNLKTYSLVNRLSIGVQSFNNKDLKLMNRRHTAKEAIESIERSREAGFNNINIDLIYGVPGMTLTTWLNNLQKFKKLELEHLSAYHLTIEPKTVFSHFQKKGKLFPITEKKSLKQFEILIRFAEENGYIHYEISNFAREGYYSKHNLAYWTGKSYLGIGPSAHSFKENERRWNVSNNTKYCDSILNNNGAYYDKETIDLRTSYNDYILTSLRTKWGSDQKFIREKYGEQISSHFINNARKFLKEGILIKKDENLILGKKGIFIADYVISELMKVDISNT
jgi:oxygen-independent coproporphyrinogen III oxidase